MITCDCGYSGKPEIALDIDRTPIEICPDCGMVIK